MSEGIDEIVNDIEATRSEPSSDTLDGGWVEPSAVSVSGEGGGSFSQTSAPISEPGAMPTGDIPEAGDTNPDADAYGEIFDPHIHTPNRAKNKDGRWRRQKGKKNAVVVIDDPGGIKRSACERAAKEFVGQFIALSIAFGGDDWIPKKEPYDERESLELSWTEYFFANGIVRMPPWCAVTIAMAAFSIPRFMMPETRARVIKLRDWIKGKGKKKPGEKDKQNASDNGRPDNGHNPNDPAANWASRVDNSTGN